MRNGLLPTRLAAFVEVAAARNFTAAARKLNVSQPALTRTIHLLEADIGARLFDRDPRNVELTPAGREVLPIAQRLLRDIDVAADDMSSFVRGARGVVRIAAIPSLAAALLPTAIKQFTEARPNVRFQLDDALANPVAEKVASGEADFGLTVLSAPDRRLSFKPLLTEEVGLVCRKDDPLAAPSRATWSDFEGRDFIAMTPETSVRNITDAAFLQAGLSIEPLFGCSVVTNIGRLVMAGLGVTALPQLSVLQLDMQELVWRPLDEPLMFRDSGILLRHGYSLSPAVADFLNTFELIVASQLRSGLLSPGIKPQAKPIAGFVSSSRSPR